MKTASSIGYPLKWPESWPRASRKFRSKFKVSSFGRVRDEIINQLKLMGASNAVISSNIPLKLDGHPYATFKTPSDSGVAVYFFYKKKQMVFACDKYWSIEDNLQAINKSIEAIRGIERWGASEMLERAFNGFAQLEAPQMETCWSILSIKEGSDETAIKAARNTLLMKFHPDRGGSEEMTIKINKAYEDAMKKTYESVYGRA